MRKKKTVSVFDPPAPHKPEALAGKKPGIGIGDLIDILPTIYVSLTREMAALHAWADYYRSIDVPFIVESRRGGKILAMWKLRKAYA